MTNDDMWTTYRLSLRVDRLVAGIPAEPRMMEAWLSTHEVPEPASEEQRAMIATFLEQSSEVDIHGTVFYRDADGTPCYESRNLKAALKEGANILKGFLDVKNFRNKLAERVFVEPRLLPIRAAIQSADRPISVMTMQGPRTSIKRYEFAEDVQLDADVRILNDGVVSESQVRTILEYLESGGIGADRSQGNGTFELLKFERA